MSKRMIIHTDLNKMIRRHYKSIKCYNNEKNVIIRTNSLKSWIKTTVGCTL